MSLSNKHDAWPSPENVPVYFFFQKNKPYFLCFYVFLRICVGSWAFCTAWRDNSGNQTLPFQGLFLLFVDCIYFFIVVLGRWYIVVLTKVLKMYQIYHTWIYPLHLLFPHFWNSYNRYHFSKYIHVYTIFAPYSLSYTTSSLPLGINTPDRTCSTLLFSNFVEKKF
jgi:hypothetical protein